MNVLDDLSLRTKDLRALWNPELASVCRLDVLCPEMCVCLPENTIRITLVCSLQEGSGVLLVNGGLNEGTIKGVLIDF